MEAYYSSSYPASKSHSPLHSVRKSQAKPWKKAPVAPPPPTPIRVYKVDAINFRDLVQQLTGAPEFKPRVHQQLFQSVASTATSLVDTPPETMLSNRDIAASSTFSTNWYQGAQSEALRMKSQETTGAATGLLELNLSSPSSYNWCSVPHMSQGTMSSLEPGRVL